MHHSKTGIKGRLGLVLGLAVLVAAIALMPQFGGTGYAVGPGQNLDNVAAISEFIIPGVPVSKVEYEGFPAAVLVLIQLDRF